MGDVARTAQHAGIAALSALLLAACGGGSDAVAPESGVAVQEAPQPAVQEPVAEAPPAPAATTPGMRQLSSDQAPFACDLLSAEDVAGVVGAETEVFDVTQKRREEGIWSESTCLFGYGENKDPHKLNLKSRFIRVDVYTDASLRNAGWGSLHDQWATRTELDARRVPFEDGVWAAWVESDHPPDPALLVRQGDVMYEIAHYPPRSSQGDAEKNAQIERLTRILLARQQQAEEGESETVSPN